MFPKTEFLNKSCIFLFFLEHLWILDQDWVEQLIELYLLTLLKPIVNGSSAYLHTCKIILKRNSESCTENSLLTMKNYLPEWHPQGMSIG